MTREEKQKIFEPLTRNFETEEFKAYFMDMVAEIPEYVFTMASSTSGKFHNSTQCQVYGQVYHVYMFDSILNHRLRLKGNKELFSTPEERDSMRCVPVFHDAIKCGWNGSIYTVHDHPMLAGTWVRETKVEHDIDNEVKEMIARMCERHSGEWTSSKRSKVILPEPETEMEILVHECDILSSRSDIDMQPSEYLKGVFDNEVTNQQLPDINEYQLTFGKHLGKTIPEIAKVDKGWLHWAKENLTREPVISLIKQYYKSQEEDEI